MNKAKPIRARQVGSMFFFPVSCHLPLYLRYNTTRPSTVSYFSYFFLPLSNFSYFLENVLLLTKNSYFFLLLRHFSYFSLNILENRIKTSLKARDRTKISPLRGTYRSKLAIGPKFHRYAALFSSSMLPCELTHVWLWVGAGPNPKNMFKLLKNFTIGIK